MTGRLHGKVAFITGAGAGIGRATAQCFAREGATVALADVAAERGEATQASIGDAGGSALFLHCDVTREESVAAAVVKAFAAFGRLDILFNCAGGSLPEDSWLTDVDMSVWDRTINVDLKGTIH